MSVDDFASPGNVPYPDATEPVVALPPAGHGVALWWVALERAPDEAARLARLLSADEHARALRFGTDALRRRWIVGRASLRMLLAGVLGLPPSEVALTRGRRGRPELAAADGLDFNVSHTRGVALVAIADRLPPSARIGIDIEHRDRAVNADGLARKFMTAGERRHLDALPDEERRRRFLRLWTCKEAMSKATGDALSAPFRTLDIAVEGSVALVGGSGPYAPADWTLYPIGLSAGFLATLAVWRPARLPDAPAA